MALSQILSKRVKSAKTTSSRSAQARARAAENKELDQVRPQNLYTITEIIIMRSCMKQNGVYRKQTQFLEYHLYIHLELVEN